MALGRLINNAMREGMERARLQMAVAFATRPAQRCIDTILEGYASRWMQHEDTGTAKPKPWNPEWQIPSPAMLPASVGAGIAAAAIARMRQIDDEERDHDHD